LKTRVYGGGSGLLLLPFGERGHLMGQQRWRLSTADRRRRRRWKVVNQRHSFLQRQSLCCCCLLCLCWRRPLGGWWGWRWKRVNSNNGDCCSSRCCRRRRKWAGFLSWTIRVTILVYYIFWQIILWFFFWVFLNLYNIKNITFCLLLYLVSIYWLNYFLLNTFENHCNFFLIFNLIFWEFTFTILFCMYIYQFWTAWSRSGVEAAVAAARDERTLPTQPQTSVFLW
jgi:hypothetical protein